MIKLMKKTLLISLLLISNLLIASETIGFYSNGRLSGAQSVFEHGTPIHKLFIARGRLYTSDEMQSVLTDASEFIKGAFPDSEILQVGDLSMRLGGLAEGHASHQNGLDADVVYLRHNKYVQSPTSPYWDEDFVDKTGPSKNFNVERNFELFKFLVKNTPVTRIFVDTVMKKRFCQMAKTNGQLKDPQTIETLRRLRPQDLHRTHFHMRIGCPVNDHECVPQSEPTAGTGCDDVSILLEEAMTVQSC
jgi:penicillin-insensitive murein endopeptidase